MRRMYLQEIEILKDEPDEKNVKIYLDVDICGDDNETYEIQLCNDDLHEIKKLLRCIDGIPIKNDS